MTGTAETEAAEFFDIYKLDVVVVPTNKPMVRDDVNDVIYKTKREKYNAVIEEIEDDAFGKTPRARGHDERRGLRDDQPDAETEKRPAQRAERQAASAGGGDRLERRAAGRDHDRDEHGRPRYRYQARPGRRARRAGCTSSGRSATRRRRIDRQLRGRAGRQGDPGSPSFSLPGRRPHAPLRQRQDRFDNGADGAEGRRGHPAFDDHPLRRARAAEGRGEQLRHQEAPAGIRQRDEPAARGDLLAQAQRASRRTAEGRGS